MKSMEKIIFVVKKVGNPYKGVGEAIECITQCFLLLCVALSPQMTQYGVGEAQYPGRRMSPRVLHELIRTISKSGGISSGKSRNSLTIYI